MRLLRIPVEHGAIAGEGGAVGWPGWASWIFCAPEPSSRTV